MKDKTKNSFFWNNWRRKIMSYEWIFIENLARKIGFFSKLLIKLRREVALKEIKMAEVSSSDRVLVVGCGVFPSTPIIVSEETGAMVVGIDNSVNAAKLAESYVLKKGLDGLISIEYGDGVSYPVEDFDVVFVAINVWPLESVLKHLSEGMRTGARLICRGVKNSVREVVEQEDLDQDFSVSFSSSYPVTKSLLLIKK